MKTFNASFAVSERMCADILTTAVESGVYGSQWLRDYDSTAEYETVQPEADYGGAESLCVSITLGTLAGNDPRECVRADRAHIDTATIARALGAALSNADAARSAAQILAGDIDGPSADVIVQLAFFGAVVFG